MSLKEIKARHESLNTGWSDSINGHQLLDAHCDRGELLKLVDKLQAENTIKSEFLSTRQCPDHSGKWERGRCLQCEIEQLQAHLKEYGWHKMECARNRNPIRPAYHPDGLLRQPCDCGFEEALQEKGDEKSNSTT